MAVTGAPPKAATEDFLSTLEDARRLIGLRVSTLARAVVDPDDVVGWARLATLGTAATVQGQQAAADAVVAYAMATLEAAGAPLDPPVATPVATGRLGSGRDVRGLFEATPGVVEGRMAGGLTFGDALAASADYLVGVAASEPHRIGRDGLLRTGTLDDRFERFRRIAEAGACDFCRMLATRGAVYLSAATAGESRKYHTHCRCHIELVVGADAIEASQELQGDWRNAAKDDQRLIDAGAMRPGSPESAAGRVTPFQRPAVTAIAPGVPRAALRVDGVIHELTDAEIVAREGSFAAGITKQRFRVYADGDVTVKVRKAADGSGDAILTDAQVQTFMGEWRAVTAQVWADMPEGYPRPIAVIDDTDMTWVREPGCLAYVNDARFSPENHGGVVRVNPRAARGDFASDGTHFAPVLGSARSAGPADRIRYVLMHELGHLHGWAWDDAYALAQTAEATAMGARVSGYAAESWLESYAEAFAEWMLAPRPSVAARRYARLVGWEAPK